MTYKLVLKFLCNSGKEATFIINDVKPTLTETEIGVAMDKIIDNYIFRPYEDKFIKKISCNLIERIDKKLEKK